MNKMLFTLDRMEHDGLATRGELRLNGRLLCLTLEDRFRPEKVHGTTRIPATRMPGNPPYELELKAVGSSRFDRKAAEIMAAAGGRHDGMVRLRDVPGFSEILIHWGNYHTNSEGCLLVGRTKMIGPDGALAVTHSQATYAALYPALAEAIANAGARLAIRNLDGTPAGK